MKNTKIALISPQLFSFSMEDLGISSIAAVLRQNDYEVVLKNIYDGEEDYSDITSFKPDIVGITCYVDTVQLSYRISSALKELLPDSIIAIGGYAPNYHAKEMLEEEPTLDYALVGEGEYSFLELADKVENKENVKDIRGLAYRQGDQFIENERALHIENMDTLPFPARDLLFQTTNNLTLISTSRGCVRSCYFCCGNDFWKKGNKYNWRCRSVKNSVDEIEYLYREHGRNQIWIIDATFEDPGFNEERMMEFANEIINRGLIISYMIFCRATFYKQASDELMKALVKSGLVEVYIGTESGNDGDLGVFGKRITVEDSINSMAFFKKHDVYPEIGFINFHPYSTLEGLLANIDFLEKYNYARFMKCHSYLNLYKGSNMYNIVNNDGLLKDNFKFYDDIIYNYKDKTVETLFYFNHGYLNKLQNDINFISEFTVFERYYSDKIAHIKRYFKLDSKVALELLEEHIKKLDVILDGFNRQISSWNRQLVLLAMDSWDESRAKEISEETLSTEYLNELLGSLKIERIRFGKQLGKKDRKLLEMIRVMDV